MLEDGSILKIGQNMKYDWKIFARHGIRITPFDDTMLMSYAMHAGLHNHGMDYLSEHYLDHTPIPIKSLLGAGKTQITFDRVGIDDAVKYAAEDADVTLRVHQVLRPQLAAEPQLESLYRDLELPLAEVLFRIERNGVLIDAATLAQQSDELGRKIMTLEAEAQALAGQPLPFACCGLADRSF